MTQLSTIFNPKITYNKPSFIRRNLGGTGVFLSSIGQEVSPHDIVGRFQVSSGFFTINLAQRLGVSTSDASKYLAKTIGSRIYKGELLASHKSLLSTTNVTSPTDGIIETYQDQTGQLQIKFFPKDINLVAGVYGIVQSIDSKFGDIVIKSITTEIKGIAGSGKPRMGLLNTLTSSSNFAKPDMISATYNQHILVCGAIIDPNLIKKAIQSGVSGLISGGINYRDYTPLINPLEAISRTIADPGISLLVTEGFGPIAIPADIYALLNQYQNQYVYLSGYDKTLHLPSTDPESLLTLRKIAMPIQEGTTPETSMLDKTLEVGQTVVLTWPSQLGVKAKIIAIDSTETMLESGISTNLITIETASRKIKVPFQNVQIS